MRPKDQKEDIPAILWIHGGGYMIGFAEMVYASCGKMLAEKYGAVVISPQYRLSGKDSYPAALEDCFAALKYIDENRKELGIDRIIVGGESAGGGLAAAVCMMARDKGEIPIRFQLPLYPMLDCYDTPSSMDNHGYFWNTSRNHRAWKLYLGPLFGSASIPKYASPSRETDYSGLPPAYTFVCDGEPFYDETLTYISNLNAAGVPASVDVYPGKAHAFDMTMPWTKKAKEARQKLREVMAPILSEKTDKGIPE